MTQPKKANHFQHHLDQLEEYWFHGPHARFAQDAGVTESTLSRLVRGKTANPRYRDICRIVALFEKKLGRTIDPREIFDP